MKAVILEVSAAELERRRAWGLDQWDEMWDGVLHMAPAPSNEHQRILEELIEWLRPLVRRHGRGSLRMGLNVFRADNDYRIPDLTFVAAGRDGILADDGVRGGGPDAVIEVRSPSDETYEKFAFYADLGVREVVVIQRDDKQVELYRLAGPQYVAVQPDGDGWLHSLVMDVRLRSAARPHPAFELADGSEPANRHVI